LNIMTLHPAGADLFETDRQTDTQDVMKQTVTAITMWMHPK